jgi:epoxide hydrolase-like predicted phosphatase
MIRAVIFDFGNVICRFDVRLFVERISRLTSTPLSTLQGILHQSFDLGREYETGLITSDEFYRKVSDRYGLSVSKERFVREFTDIFTPIPSTLTLVRKLKPFYKLGLLSNTNEWHFEHAIKKVEVFPLFDAVTVSFQVRAMKPAEKMYRDILAKLQVTPEECIYIDDVRENVEVARHLGMFSIHYTAPEELHAQLHSVGVDP